VVASNTVFSVVTQGFLANGGDSYPTVIENIKRLVDFDEPDSLGKANLRPGRIQDAFAEYLSAFYNNNNGQQPFNQADTPQSEDKRIQSLGFRQDTVLDGITPLLTNINGTTGDDVFDAAVRDGKQFIGNNQLLNTGSGNDTVNVRFAVGGNNIRTASGMIYFSWGLPVVIISSPEGQGRIISGLQKMMRSYRQIPISLLITEQIKGI